jgi:hypothetical protein
MKLLVLALVCLSALSRPASADVSKAWAAAKDHLPATTRAVGAIDVGAFVKTTSFQAIFTALVKQEPDLGKAYELVKQTCKVDPVQVIEGVIVAGDPDAEKGIVLVQHTMDRKKASTCMQDMLKAVGETKAIVKQDGKFTTIGDGKNQMYLMWVTDNVVAIALDPDKRTEYDRWLGGKGALKKTPLVERVEKLDTKALAFGALQLEKPLDDKELPVLAATGTITLVNKTATVKLRGTFKDAAAAARVLAEARKELDREVQRGKLPDSMKRIAKSVKMVPAGADLSLDATASEADLLDAAALMFR